MFTRLTSILHTLRYLITNLFQNELLYYITVHLKIFLKFSISIPLFTRNIAHSPLSKTPTYYYHFIFLTLRKTTISNKIRFIIQNYSI